MNSGTNSANWSTTTRVIVVTVVLVLVGWFIVVVRPLIGPMIVAALLAYTLHPLVVRLQNRFRLQHRQAVALVYFPFLIILFATPSTLVPVLVRQIRTLSDEVIGVLSAIERWLEEPVILLGRTLSQEELANFFSSITETFTPAAEDAIQVLETTSTSLLWFIVILVTIFYLLSDWEGLRAWLLRLFPEREQKDISRLLHEINITWRSYLRGTLTLMFIMGIFITIVGLAIGLPGAVALGLLTGLLSIIPELGPTIAGILSALVALFEGSNFLPLSNFWFAVLVGGIYLVVMQLKSLWLRPMVMGRFMHMNTGLVFVAIIGSALISGVLAALIILPVLATVGQIGNYVRRRLYNLPPWPEEIVVEMPEASSSRVQRQLRPEEPPATEEPM
jgi:predicted PurR-regulated permease PerM